MLVKMAVCALFSVPGAPDGAVKPACDVLTVMAEAPVDLKRTAVPVSSNVACEGIGTPPGKLLDAPNAENVMAEPLFMRNVFTASVLTRSEVRLEPGSAN